MDGKSNVTEQILTNKKGQWPYRAATVKNNHAMYNFYYCGICCCLPETVILVASEAMVTSKQPQLPPNSNLTSDLMQATFITLASICILPRRAIMVASDAIAASKRPLRSLLTSNLNSVASITYDLVLFWPLNCCI